MKLITKGPRRFGELVRFLSAPRESLQYVGFLGHRNLGDEALFEAIQQYLSPRKLTPWIHIPSIRRMTRHKRFSGLILGGGTLIGGKTYLGAVEEALDQGCPGFVFGTGVRDPEFWQSRPDKAIPLARWGEAISRCRMIGVRGPDSKARLDAIGIESEVIGDPACCFVQAPEFWQPYDRVIGINIGQSAGQSLGSDDHVRRQLASFLRVLLQKGWRVEFFVVVATDEPITRQTAKEAGIASPVIWSIYECVDAFLSQARYMSAFVGVKLHATVLALCAGVPSIMIEYRPKCRDFMRSVDQQDVSISAGVVSTDRLVDLHETIMSASGETSSAVLQALQSYKQRQSGFATRLLQEVASTSD